MFTPSKVSILDAGWKINTDPTNIGRQEQWFNQYPGQDAPSVPVPGIIQQVYPGYHGVAWYWLEFAPELAPSPFEEVFLHFGAVDYYAEVWLNAVYVGAHEGGETPFDLNVTSAYKTTANNLLAVRIINPSNDPIDSFVLAEVPHSCKVIPYRVGAGYDHGGIVLPVELRILPVVRIADVFAQANPESGKVKLDMSLANDAAIRAKCRLTATIGSGATGDLVTEALVTTEIEVEPGAAAVELELQVRSPRLWSPEDPALYTIQIFMEAAIEGASSIQHTYGVRCGFRDFRIGADGYFRLNGRRIFLRSSHTVNNFPIGMRIPHNADIWRRDLVYAKAAGMNMIRFIAGMAYPEQLNLCDEIGLMVYEETYAGWCLADSPQMADRFNRSIWEMVRRDRNHPSLVVWGLLNETVDNPISRHAKGMLPSIRALDDTRLVLLNSGRWDGEQSIGSASNPGTSEWQYAWGDEAPGAPSAGPLGKNDILPLGGYYDRVGDAHVYPGVPHDAATIRFLRTLGAETKPVFLSEYGIGSLVDAIRVTRLYEQIGLRPDLEDATLYRAMADQFVADWHKYGMDGVYPFPDDMLRESQRLQ